MTTPDVEFTEEEKAQLATEIRLEANGILDRLQVRFSDEASIHQIINHLIYEIAVLKLEVKIIDKALYNEDEK